jgi:hypothetical protein
VSALAPIPAEEERRAAEVPAGEASGSDGYEDAGSDEDNDYGLEGSSSDGGGDQEGGGDRQGGGGSGSGTDEGEGEGEEGPSGSDEEGGDDPLAGAGAGPGILSLAGGSDDSGPEGAAVAQGRVCALRLAHRCAALCRVRTLHTQRPLRTTSQTLSPRAQARPFDGDGRSTHRTCRLRER